MNTIYYLISYLRIIPRKTAIAAYNYYYGIKHLPAIRMEKLPLTNRVWNHITNLYIEPTEILPGLYLGNAYNASNYSTIQYYNIKNILNISKELPNYFENNTDITYKKIEIIILVYFFYKVQRLSRHKCIVIQRIKIIICTVLSTF